MATIRRASDEDVTAVIEFGKRVIPDHYSSLIGADAAQKQVDDWWTTGRLGGAAADGRLLVAETEGEIAAVAEWSVYEGTPVIWKLYVAPEHRGQGLGPRLLEAVEAGVPQGTERIAVEHFAANTRASAFYEREGFSLVRTVPHGTDARLDVLWRERVVR